MGKPRDPLRAALDEDDVLPVVRLHLRSTHPGVDHREQERFCLAEPGWAGVGWGCWDDTPSDISWAEYQERKQAASELVNESVRRMYELPVGTLIWTRRRDGSYWLGELTGEWRYRGDQQAKELDLFNIRPCSWWMVGTEDSVPGKIVNNFRGPKTVNSVADRVAVEYTRRVHAQLSGREVRLQPIDPAEVIVSLLNPEDLEDLVAVYLQDCFNLVLVSRGRSTPGYEYVLRHRVTGRRAVASVKSGGSVVDLDRLPDDADVDAYVYAVSGRVLGTKKLNVREISTADLVEFVLRRRIILPDCVTRWLG